MAAIPEAIATLLAKEGTGISWANLTFNPWIGCQEVSPACRLCYAREFTNARVNAARVKAGKPPIVWGPGGARQQTSPANRKKPIRWNAIAKAAGHRLRVFCASLADWADNAVPNEWRAELADLIRATPWLDWMMLTKRVGIAASMLRAMFPEGVPPNVWIGVTICNQEEADRDIPKALALKGALGVTKLFLSVEPMLGHIDITPWLWGRETPCEGCPKDEDCPCGYMTRAELGLPTIDLVICGGESGVKATPMHPVWPLELGHQCFQAKVLFHFKQWGEWWPSPVIITPPPGVEFTGVEQVKLGDKVYKGDRVFRFPDGVIVVRVGARAAGHLIDGKEYREMIS